MEVLKFKSAPGRVTTFRHYPISTIKKISHTKSENSETLTVFFNDGSNEVLTDVKDIKKVLATLDTFVANKNQIAVAEEKNKAKLDAIKHATEQKKKARAAQLAKAEKYKAEIAARNTLKKVPKKRSEERKAARKTTSNKTTKKVSKKASKKITKNPASKKVTKKKSKKKKYKK
jgi:hypothetical protein